MAFLTGLWFLFLIGFLVNASARRYMAMTDTEKKELGSAVVKTAAPVAKKLVERMLK